MIQPLQPTERDLTLNGLRHRVLEWDGGGRRTVLCLHGFLDLAWSWQTVAPLLAAAGHHVIAPDLRGHGDSDRIGAGGYYHFFDYVFDMAELVDALGRDGLVLAGHSMGGVIASYFAASFPDRVERLAVLEGFALRDEPLELIPRRTADWIRAVRRARNTRPRTYPSIEAAATRLRELDPRCPPELARFLAEKGTRETPEGRTFKHDPVHLTRGPLPSRLEIARAYWSAIRCPTLLVTAAESEYLMQFPDLDAHLRAFPGARRVTIAECGHMMLRHQPGEVARRLLEFLAE